MECGREVGKNDYTLSLRKRRACPLISKQGRRVVEGLRQAWAGYSFACYSAYAFTAANYDRTKRYRIQASSLDTMK